MASSRILGRCEKRGSAVSSAPGESRLAPSWLLLGLAASPTGGARLAHARSSGQAHDMRRAVRFYRVLGFAMLYGGEDEDFTSFKAGSNFVNLIAQPAGRQWSWGGRGV